MEGAETPLFKHLLMACPFIYIYTLLYLPVWYTLHMNKQTIYFESGELTYCDGGTPSKFWNPNHGKFRSKHSHPYSYDPILIWGDEHAESSGSVYTDRLLQWDFDKHDELCKKHFGNKGQYWNDRDPKLIEAFMRDWTDNQNLTLVFVTEFCNQSNGYPCWLLGYKED